MANKSILFVCPYPNGKAPSQRLKFEQYFSFFQSHGWSCRQISFQSKAMWDVVYRDDIFFAKIWYTLSGYLRRFIWLFRLPFYDVVYIHLWVTPFGFPLFELLYRKLSKKIIYDIDDLVFMSNSSRANAWIEKFKGRYKPIFLMKTADAIITTTPFLVDYCKKWNPYIYDIPPTLDENVFFPMKKKEQRKFTIGWMGSHTTAAYLDIVRPALEILAKEFDYRMVVMGAENFTVPGIEITLHEWSAALENEVLNEMDIALYPLRDEIWSQGKFGGKLIQYFAAGLPCISSDVSESNRLTILPMENGLLAKNTTEDWLKGLRILVADDSLRMKIGARARLDFLEKYSIRANEKKYLNILNSVVKN